MEKLSAPRVKGLSAGFFFSIKNLENGLGAVEWGWNYEFFEKILHF